MRGSQVFAGLVIIALLAMGLVYLEAHGYFRDQRTTAMGQLKPDANAPKAEPPEADEAGLSASNSSASMTGDVGAHPVAVPTSAAPSSTAPTSAAPNMPASSAAVSTPAAPVVTYSNATQPTSVTYPTAQPANFAHETINTTPQPSNVSQAVASPQATRPVATTPMATTPAAPSVERTRVIYKIVYVDAQGNVCQAKRVPVRTVTVSATPRVHHSYQRHFVDNTAWIYGRQAASTPAPQPRRSYMASTACSLLHQTVNGSRVVNLPSGMAINVALDRQLSTMDSVAGQEFQGYLVGPITYCGEVVVPAGAIVQGNVLRTRRRAALSEDEAVLQLRLSGLDANGFNVPLTAFSSSRRMAGEVPYSTVETMDGPNYLETARDSTRDVTLPAQSVVSFSLRSGTAVNF